MQRAKSQAPSVSAVNAAARGLPFFLPKTLSPVWEAKEEIVKMPTFQLVDQDGKLRDQTMFEGKVSLVAFFFATCSGFCPALIDKLKEIESVAKDQPNLQFVVMTVDPERDTAERLKLYAKNRRLSDKNWVLLTGDRSTIFSIAKDTFVSEAFKRASGKSFVHSEHFYLIDQVGRLRTVLNGTRIDVPSKAKLALAELGT